MPINKDRITANENLPEKEERSFYCELFRLLVLMSSHVLRRKLKCFPLEKWGGGYTVGVLWAAGKATEQKSYLTYSQK